MNFILVEHGYYGCWCECCGTDFILMSGESKKFMDAKEISRGFEFAHFYDEEDKLRATILAQQKAKNWKWEYGEIVFGDLLGSHKEKNDEVSS